VIRQRAWARGCLVLPCLLALAVGLGCRDAAAPPARETATVVREIDVPPGALALPLSDGSVRFAAIGDSGRGDQAQHTVAEQMIAWRERFPFDFVVMLGDNVYDSHTPADYRAKFEEPYRALREAGVEFHAALGNHDDPKQIHYEPFNMGGHRYFTFRKAERRLAGLAGAGVRFFVLDTVSLDADQIDWLRRELDASGTHWKIAFFHHPLYTSGRYQTAAGRLRNRLEHGTVPGQIGHADRAGPRVGPDPVAAPVGQVQFPGAERGADVLHHGQGTRAGFVAGRAEQPLVGALVVPVSQEDREQAEGIQLHP
jgi:hypothetical protein